MLGVTDTYTIQLRRATNDNHTKCHITTGVLLLLLRACSYSPYLCLRITVRIEYLCYNIDLVLVQY